MVAGLLALGARALPLLGRVGPAIAEGIGSAGTLARVVGAGATKQGGSATRATAQILRQENVATRAAFRRKTGQLTLEDLAANPLQMGVKDSYAEAAKVIGGNQGLFNTAYKTGGVLNKVAGAVNSPVANVALTGAFLAPMLLPQGQAEYATEPFNNAYTQLPTPSGAQFAADPRTGELIGGMQAAVMSNDQQGKGGGGAPYGLTDEQIVKAKRRAEETAQLNQLYASTLSGYQMPN